MRWLSGLCVLLCSVLLPALASAKLSDVPFTYSTSDKPKMLLLMSRDQEMSKKAYLDYIDMDGDGKLDTTYNNNVQYDGYFNPDLCYSYSDSEFSYNGTTGLYTPADTADNHKCSGKKGPWSGNLMNYANMTRMDIVRKVLYGGKRILDPATPAEGSVILERSYLPQDVHSFAKVISNTTDYKISDLTPFTGKNNITLCTTSLNNSASPNVPKMAMRSRADPHMAIGERQQCNYYGDDVAFTVRVQVCDGTLDTRTNFCRQYGNGNFKPMGLLQKYGEDDAIQFGLMTSSYQNYTKGGVLRKPIGSFLGDNNDDGEVNPETGVINRTYEDAPVVSIINVIDSMRIVDYGWEDRYFMYWHCNTNYSLTKADFLSTGQCPDWGNPLAEMYTEALKYLVDEDREPTAAYAADDRSFFNNSELFAPQDWGGVPWKIDDCASCSIVMLASSGPTFDADNLGDVGSFNGINASAISSATNEVAGLEGLNGQYLIGETSSNQDEQCSVKSVTPGDFANLRGLCPEGPTKEGSYQLVGAMRLAATNDFGRASGSTIDNYVFSLSTTLPYLSLKYRGNTISVAPSCQSWGEDERWGTCSFISVVMEDVDNDALTGETRHIRTELGWEDASWGADNDMDYRLDFDICIGDACPVEDGLPAVDSNQIRVATKMTFNGASKPHIQGFNIAGVSASGSYQFGENIETNQWYVQTFYIDNDLKNDVALPSPLELAAKYGRQMNSSNTEGRPDNYYEVRNFNDLLDGLENVFSYISRNKFYSASVSGSGYTTEEGEHVYYSSYDNVKSWNGHFMSYSYDKDGKLQKDWDAAEMLEQADPDTRVMLSIKEISQPFGYGGVPFRATNLHTRQKNLISGGWNSGPTTTTPSYADFVNYIRGDHSLEKTTLHPTNPFRERVNSNGEPTRLGDIVHSSAAFVGGTQTSSYMEANNPGTGYNEWAKQYADRQPMIYVGANDSVFHGFNANNGRERIGYVSTMTYNQIGRMARPDYDESLSHRFSADGSPTVRDAYFNGSWHTVVASGLNAGGKGVFALDVTDPDNFAESNARSIVLFEFNDIIDRVLLNGQLNGPIPSTLGYTYSKPAIVKLNDGRWAAVFGNGYYSDAGVPVLIIVYLDAIRDNGTWNSNDVVRLYTATPTDETAGSENGLSNIAPIDTDDDGDIDLIYAGDLEGNMWRFDLRSSSTSDWQQGIAKLFEARDSNGQVQPIVAQPEVGLASRESEDYDRGYRLYFGTGKYMDVGDDADLSVQSFYSIKDDLNPTPIAYSRGSLTQQYISLLGGVSGVNYRSITNYETNHKGWFVDLKEVGHQAQGERVVEKALLRRAQIIFSTLIPHISQCTAVENGWLMALDAPDGHSSRSVFDTNGDGSIDTEDLVNGERAAGMSIASAASVLLQDNGDSQIAVSVSDEGTPDQIAVAKSAMYRQKRVNWQHVRIEEGE
ncbi:pilus assembly protein [Pokkaliibacter sp. CJK22405]|uniref:pilus assembly protein n=1 Tax=Pokkaliibacter sp. CJK22405 TaxID=3384615 RepID=UPI00398502B9